MIKMSSIVGFINYIVGMCLIYPTRGHPVYKRQNIQRVAFSNQAIFVLDKLEEGLECIISALSIHPEGPVVLWLSVWCPGRVRSFSPSEGFSSVKQSIFGPLLGVEESSKWVNIHYYGVFSSY